MTDNNFPQSNALISEIFIFIAGGFDFAASLGWNYRTYTLEFLYCWFIGVVIGAFVAAPLIYNLQSRFVQYFACLLMFIGGMVTVTDYNNLRALIAARYLTGIGLGFTTVEFIVRASEIAAPKHRAFCLSLEQFGLYIGVFVQVLYTVLWSTATDFSPDCLRGIFCLVFAVLAVAATFFHIESPVYYFIKGDEEAARNCVDKLFRPHGMTETKQWTFNELRNYVADSQSRPFTMSLVQAHPPLLKMVFYRAMLAFITALPLNLALVIISLTVVQNLTMWPSILYSVLAYLGVALAICLYNWFGTKLVSLYGLLVAGVCTIAVGALLNDLDLTNTYRHMLAAFVLLLIAQFFGGFYVASTTIFLGEAFPLHNKAIYVAVCVIVEYLVQLVIVCTFTWSIYNIFAFCVAVGVLMCFFCLNFLATIPETKNTTLLEAERRFAIWRNYQSY